MHPSNVIVVPLMYGAVTIKCANWAKFCGVPILDSVDGELFSLILFCAIATVRIPCGANSTDHTRVIASMLALAVSLAACPNNGYFFAEIVLMMTPFSPSGFGSLCAIKPTPRRTILNVPTVFAWNETLISFGDSQVLANWQCTYHEDLLEIFQIVWLLCFEIVHTACEWRCKRMTIYDNIQLTESLFCFVHQRNHVVFRTDIRWYIQCITADGFGNGSSFRCTHIAQYNTGTFASKIFGSRLAQTGRATSHQSHQILSIKDKIKLNPSSQHTNQMDKPWTLSLQYRSENVKQQNPAHADIWRTLVVPPSISAVYYGDVSTKSFNEHVCWWFNRGLCLYESHRV